ncbi:MAG: amidohydrolase [Planctomycetota bacterium]|nr:amidohydrolase [Planctomycetota bacterium]
MDYAAIVREARRLRDEVVRLRRRIHSYPELAFEERRTGRLAAGYLKALGLKVRSGIAKTGVVGLLDIGAKQTIGLRADMDALPVTEQTGLPFASRIPGRMHACGHDAHVAMLLATARLLCRHRNELRSNVKFIFQPSEETPPGGAAPMIRAGALERPHVDAMFGMHCDSSLPTGKIGIKHGVAMANADNVNITVIGRGGHAARPHESVDAIATAGAIVSILQTIVSRNINPVEPTVITLGTVRGGTKSNIICDRVEMQGTMRSVTLSTRRKLPALVARVARGVANSMGAEADVQVFRGYPLLKNHAAAVRQIVSLSHKLFGNSSVVFLEHPVMGAEDFAYYLRKAQGAFIRLGTANPRKKSIYPWHHPKFNVDEDALPVGVALFAALALGHPDETA